MNDQEIAIPPTFLLPPSIPSSFVPRSRLTTLVHHHFKRARVILVEAKGGYGKSLAFAHYGATLSYPAVWYPLDRLRQWTPFSFLWNLLQAIRVRLPNLGEAPLATLNTFSQVGSWDPEVGREILNRLRGELQSLPHPVLIILENYHTIPAGNEEIEPLIQYLVEATGDVVRFVVTSRQVVRWKVRGRWQGQEVLASLSEEDLAFTPAEHHTLMGRAGLALSAEESEAIYQKLKGWPILHYLLAQALSKKTPRELRETLEILVEPGEVIYDYLAGEILQNESPTIQAFLCKTSILTHLDVDICNELLEIQDAGELLRQAQKSLFLSRLGVGFVHSHEFARAFLQKALVDTYERQSILRLYEWLGKLWERREEWHSAIESYLHAEQVDYACRVIEGHAPELLNSAQFVRLQQWLNLLPPSIVEREPFLLVCRGIIRSDQQNPLADRDFKVAIHLFQENGDSTRKAWALGELGWMYWSRKQFGQSLEALNQALEEPLADTYLEAKLLHYKALALAGIDDYASAIEQGERAIQLLDETNTVQAKVALARLLRHLCLIYRYYGGLKLAAQRIARAYELTKALDLGVWAIAWVNNQLAEVYRNIGRTEEALTYLDEAMQGLKAHGLPSQTPLTIYLSNTRAHIHREQYEYAQAEACYRRSPAGQRGLLLALYLSQGGHEREALDLALQEWQEAQRLESVVDRANFEMLVGLAYLGVQRWNEAQLHLEAALAVLQSYHARFNATTVQMYLAYLFYRLGKKATSRRLLAEALSTMATEGYYGLDVWQPWWLAELCAQAIEYNIERSFVCQLILTRLRVEHAEPLLRLVNHPERRVRSMAIELVGRLGATWELWARQALNEEESLGDDTRDRLRQWLDAGWLTPSGLVRLHQLLPARRLEVFLLWINPHLQGSIQEIARLLHISVDTVNTHLKIARETLDDTFAHDFPRGKGAHAAYYAWAIQEHFVDPHQSGR